MIDVNKLTALEKTALVPLFARAIADHRCVPAYTCNGQVFSDSISKYLVSSIDYDFLAGIIKDSMVTCVARTICFDNEIIKYIKRTKYSVIVDLGGGFDTGSYRVKNYLYGNGEIKVYKWINIDTKNIIKVRTEILPDELEKQNFLYSIATDSIFDWVSDWVPQVKGIAHGLPHVLFVASGFMQYYTLTEVKTLLSQIQMFFPKSEIIFDAVPNELISPTNHALLKAGLADAKIRWGIDDIRKSLKNHPIFSNNTVTEIYQSILDDKHQTEVFKDAVKQFAEQNKTSIVHIKFAEAKLNEQQYRESAKST
jgi:O-methyltransferase involved in polyketide biosynthesis